MPIPGIGYNGYKTCERLHIWHCHNVLTNKKPAMEGNMHRKLMLTIATALVLVMTVSMAFAMGGGNARKGKFLYRKNCYKTCHAENAGGLSPATKTQAEWTAIFADMSKIPCADKWPAIPEKDLNDIFTYLHDFAKDSPSPAKCS